MRCSVFGPAAILVAVAACVPGGSTPTQRPRPATNPVDASISDPPRSDAGTLEIDAGAPPDARDAGARPEPDAGPPAPPDAGPPPPPDQCVEGPNKRLQTPLGVYYGTDQPTHVPLSEGQVIAIGNFGGCTGTLVAPTWVASASHCGHRRGVRFCLGRTPTSEDACFTAVRAIDHPSGDLSILELDRDALAALPGVEPIPMIEDDLDRSWVGRTAEAAGYGRQETGRSGRREFTAEPIVAVQSDSVVIDGQGQRGVCFGDSGGPLMAIGTDGLPRIIGVLSYGDPSCTGRDTFTRLDVYRSWIEGYTGPLGPTGPRPCGAVTPEGRCEDASTAVWCEADELQRLACGPGTQCAYAPAAGGFRCVTPDQDPCGGLDYDGRCDGQVLSWCDRGVVQTRDCGACLEACVPGRDGGRYCVPSDCGDLTFLGRCDGDTAVWCNRDGQRETRACRNGCAYIDAETGYFCR